MSTAESLPTRKPTEPTFAPPQWIPVKRLGRKERDAMVQHLTQLSAEDRYLRFGYAASDEQVRRYVQGLQVGRDQLFGVFNRQLQLVAFVHLAEPSDRGPSDEAELGISVSTHLRGIGLGKRLFEHAMLLARNRGITVLRIHALSENRVMLHLAQSAGATVEHSGSEAEAVLRLPPGNISTWWEVWLEDRAAGLDYSFKHWTQDQQGKGAADEAPQSAVPRENRES